MPHADVAFQGKAFEPQGSLITRRIFQGKDEGIIKTALTPIRPPKLTTSVRASSCLCLRAFNIHGGAEKWKWEPWMYGLYQNRFQRFIVVARSYLLGWPPEFPWFYKSFGGPGLQWRGGLLPSPLWDRDDKKQMFLLLMCLCLSSCCPRPHVHVGERNENNSALYL